MKLSLPLSVFFHLVIVLSGLFVWQTMPEPTEVTVIDVPLDLVELADETNIEEVIRPRSTPTPEPESADDLVEQDGEEDASPPEESAPEEAADVPPLAEPDVTPEPDPTPEPVLEEDEPEEQPPITQRREERTAEDDLNDLFSSTDDLLENLADQPERREQRIPTHELDDDEPERRGAGDRTGNEAQVIDVLRSHINQRECWRSTKDLPDWQNLDVTVVFQLDAQGRLTRPPRILRSSRPVDQDRFIRAAADRAIRAVSQCQPYPLSEEEYQRWRNEDIILTFDEAF